MNDTKFSPYEYPYISLAQYSRLVGWFSLTGEQREKLAHILSADARIMISDIYASDMSPETMNGFKEDLVKRLEEKK
jgi:hypothetical protein